ncbi:MAG: NADH-quinone oxidoreductase subunit J [Candidatus Bipolaricaulia bacterium]
MSLFIIVSLFTIGSAIMTVKTHTLTYSALWLAATLVGVAGLFLTLGAEFLAVIQVVVYAGAVVSLILFAIMFAQHREEDDE